jgi:phosphatidylglycerophosphate synthase
VGVAEVFEMTVVNIPNTLTTVRGLLSLPLVYFILTDQTMYALGVFVLAVATEIDGTIARKFNQETHFGAVYDPLIDGVFTGLGILALLYLEKVSLLMISLLVLANIPRMILMKLFYKRRKKFYSTRWTKFSGLLIFFIIPLALVNFMYLNWFIGGVILLTIVLMINVAWKYYKK